jgi:hypothetical protein
MQVSSWHSKPGMRSKARNSLLRCLRNLLGAVILLCAAQATLAQCGAEAKLLVSPNSAQTSVSALHAETESQRQIYLFDTDGLEMLLHGVILRLRTGTRGDLTVKVRSENGNPERTPDEGKDTKCEVDIVGSTALSSYSLVRRWKQESIPRTGEALYAALNTAQQRLLARTGISIDWRRVKQIARVQTTEWRVRGDGSLKDISIELWQWPSGTVLELSAKTETPESGRYTLDLLRRMALASGLTIEKDQEAKTSIVLHAATASARHE